jgi:hypothetical protein
MLICIVSVVMSVNDAKMNITINDKRLVAEFKGISFSTFKKSKVIDELIQCLINSKIEPACYWCSELICAGHFGDVWDIIILYVSKYIHLGNPKLPIYIAKRIEQFKAIVSNGYLEDELTMRNHTQIRNLFAEIIAILCLSRKKHPFEPMKIKKEEEFNISFMSSRLKAPSIDFATSLFRKDDPKELFIAINEFAYHISRKSKNAMSACYWLEWIIDYETICKSKKETCSCETREFAPVGEKFKKDPIWIVWDAILSECKERKDLITTKIIDALLSIFCIKFTSGVKRRRRFIVYFAISLLADPVDFTIEILSLSQKKQVEKVVEKIHIVYRDVKKNEIIPEEEIIMNTDGMSVVKPERTNLDKTIERLEKMNQIMNGKM